MPEKLSQGPRIGYDLAKTGAGLSRGPFKGKTLPAAPWSQTWPAPQASLDLDFANDRGYVRGVGQGRSMDAVTFTRASNATYVNEQGLLVTHANQGALGNNLIQFPQDFDNAYWAKSNVTITANTEVAPDGTLTADTYKATSTASGISRSSIVSAGTFTLSCYFKTSGSSSVGLLITTSGNGTIGTFNLVNETYTISAQGTGGTTSNRSATITNAGNGWYRCSITCDSSGTNNIIIGGAGLITDDFYLWGAQLELGSTATEYFPTNINQPRFDWASTAVVANKNDFIIYTEQFDNSSWLKVNASISADVIATTDPFGGNNADKLIDNATTNFHLVRQTHNSIQNVSKATFSVYAKAAEKSWLLISAYISTDAICYFNLTNGTLGTMAANCTGTITSVGNDWYRCSVTRTVTTGTYNILHIIAVANGNNAGSYLGNGTDGIYVFGANLNINNDLLDYQQVGSAVPSTTPLTANPTSNGLLIEESRTNRILWNRDATQANWVKTDVTAAKDQTGIDGVASAASSLTATADNGTCIQTITLASGSRTGSVYLKRITGTGTVQVSLDGSTWSSVELSNTEWRRIVLSGTVTNPVVGIRLNTSGDSIAMDYAQVEDGAFATTPILTTTATVTRSADFASMLGENFLSWYQFDKGMLFVDAKTSPAITAVNHFYVLIQNNSGTNVVVIYRVSSTGNINSDIIVNGVVQALISTINPGNNLLFKSSVRVQRDNFAISTNGQVAVNDTSGLIPFVDRMFIGNRSNGDRCINSTIKRILFCPKNLNDVVLQELTK